MNLSRDGGRSGNLRWQVVIRRAGAAAAVFWSAYAPLSPASAIPAKALLFSSRSHNSSLSSNLSNNQWSFSQRSRLLHNSSNFNNGQGHTFLCIHLNQRKMICEKRVGFFCYSYPLYSRGLWQRQMWMSLPRLLCAKMRNDVCTAMLLWALRTSEFLS